MKIAIDVDGVLADHTASLRRSEAERTGVELRRTDLTTFDVTLPDSEVTVQSRIDAALADDEYLAEAPPIDGAAWGLRSLREAGHEVLVATHRPSKTHGTTRAWLDDHGIPYDRYLSDVPRNKGDVTADVLVDDYHGNVSDALDAEMDAILFEQPWNRLYAGAFPAECIAADWRSVVERIEDLSQ